MARRAVVRDSARDGTSQELLSHLSALKHASHRTPTYKMHVPSPSRTHLSPRRRKGGLPIDHTQWIAVVIEIFAIGAAIAFAYLHTAP
jgi:hypothetical protein